MGGLELQAQWQVFRVDADRLAHLVDHPRPRLLQQEPRQMDMHPCGTLLWLYHVDHLITDTDAEERQM